MKTETKYLVGVIVAMLVIGAFYFGKSQSTQNTAVDTAPSDNDIVPSENSNFQTQETKPTINNRVNPTPKDDGLMTIYVPKAEITENGVTAIFTEYSVPKSPKVLTSVYKKLFELRGTNNIWNGLSFDSVKIVDNVATVKLIGSWYPGGDLSSAYFKKEIEAAAFQYDTVNTLKVFLGDKVFDWCVDNAKDGCASTGGVGEYWIVSR